MTNSKKIVFFVANLTSRPHRRIQETIEQGFDVDVYCLCKEEGIVTPNYEVTYFIESKLSSLSYSSRFSGLLPKILKCIKLYDKKNTIFYFFSLNTALATLFCRLNYVYEESDMLFDRFRSSFLRMVVKKVNLFIIKSSKFTVFTSEGFAQYYYGNVRPDNIIFIPNKVNKECLSLPQIVKNVCDINHIRFGFVGKLRYKTLYNFAEVIADKYPQHEFHFFGKNGGFTDEEIKYLESKGNVFFHGIFKNPVDLPEIYSMIDFVVATYDTTGINPRYAEPNKMYEAIFFRTPIIVSKNSFLQSKVEQLNIGFALNAMDKNEIEEGIKSINKITYQTFSESLFKINKEDVVGVSKELFVRLQEL